MACSLKFRDGLRLSTASFLDLFKSHFFPPLFQKQTLAAEHKVQIQLILLYAPTDDRPLMEEILRALPPEMDASSHWQLMPMLTKNNSDLTSSDLGAKLTDALLRVRQIQQSISENTTHNDRTGPVVFLGMDSPETPLDELEAVFLPSHQHEAVLCPAADGGYGMLSVPSTIDASTVFAGIRWSQPLTAVSQLKALSDAATAGSTRLTTRLGRLMYDVDEPEDVRSLWTRLQRKQSNKSGANNTSRTTTDVLLRSSAAPGRERNGSCPLTYTFLEAVFQTQVTSQDIG